MSPVQIEVEALFVVLRHLADGRTADDAWALGSIDATDLIVRERVSS